MPLSFDRWRRSAAEHPTARQGAEPGSSHKGHNPQQQAQRLHAGLETPFRKSHICQAELRRRTTSPDRPWRGTPPKYNGRELSDRLRDRRDRGGRKSSPHTVSRFRVTDADDPAANEKAERLGHAVARDKGSSVVQAPLPDDGPVSASLNDTDSGDSSDQDTPHARQSSKRKIAYNQHPNYKPTQPNARIPVPTAIEELQGVRPGFYSELLVDTLKPVTPENHKHNAYVLNTVLSKVHSWKAVTWIFRDLGDCCDRINISTACHRLAKLSTRARVPLEEIQRQEGYQQLIKVIRKFFKGMSPRSKANVLWALATLREAKNGIFDDCLNALEQDGFDDEWKYQELSNVSWAMGVMERRRMKLLEGLAVEVLKRDTLQFAPQAISNLAWSFASLNFGMYPAEASYTGIREQLFMALAEGSWPRLQDFESQAVSNTIWAFGNIGFYHQKLCAEAAKDITRRARDFSNQEISNALIGLAKLSVVDTEMIEVVEVELTRHERFASMKNQVLANVLWSLATVRYYSDTILSSFRDEASKRMFDMQNKEVSNVMWAFAKLGFYPGELLNSFNAYAVQNLEQFNAQATSNVLWALAVLQATHLPCFQKLIDHLGTMDIRDVDVVQLHQLFQALLLATLERKYNPQNKDLFVPPEVVNLITKVWKKLVHRTCVSNFQRDVSEQLTEMGIEHIEEYRAEEGLFSIDIAFSAPNYNRVAMEVDGPFHYTCNTHQPLGSTLLRHRLLRALGWTVVSIAYFDYYKLNTPLEKMQYIAQKLHDVGVHVDPRRIQEALARQQAAIQAEASTSSRSLFAEEMHAEHGQLLSPAVETRRLSESAGQNHKQTGRMPLRNPLAGSRKPLQAKQQPGAAAS